MYSDTWVQNIQDTPVAGDSMGTQCTQIHMYKTLTTLQVQDGAGVEVQFAGDGGHYLVAGMCPRTEGEVGPSGSF